MFRKAIFWIHLSCGVAASLVIAMMSVTGVILTYERQMLAWADRHSHREIEPAGQRLSVEALAASAGAAAPDFEPSSIVVPSDPAEAVVLGAGRSGQRLVDPYTGELLGEGAAGLRRFFGDVTGWHRWFNVSREGRAPWRAITGASNLVFLFLLVSGVYLWLPRVYKWAAFRARLLFARRPLTGHARDYNWHHVLGIWSAVPLIVVVATASVFYYPWANALVYRAFGEEPPARGGRAGAVTIAAAGGDTAPADVGGTAIERPLPLDALFEIAAARVDEWRRITVDLPGPDDTEVSFSIDRGSGGQPQHRHAVTIDRYSGAVTEWAPFESRSPGRRARSWIRFLHTGEALGLPGQTVAGLVSLVGVVMVWTGLALAYRRLVAPLFKRKRG